MSNYKEQTLFRIDFLDLYMLDSAIDTIIKQGPLSKGQKMRLRKQYTSRVHVADICQALNASILKRSPW